MSDYVTNDQDIEDPIDEGMANSDQQLGSFLAPNNYFFNI